MELSLKHVGWAARTCRVCPPLLKHRMRAEGLYIGLPGFFVPVDHGLPDREARQIPFRTRFDLRGRRAVSDARSGPDQRDHSSVSSVAAELT